MGSNSLSLFSGFAGIGLFYFFSHFLRALKFWVLRGSEPGTFRKVFLVFFATSILGFYLPLVYAETLRIFLLILIFKNRSLTFLSYILYRSMDFLLHGSLSLGLYFTGAGLLEGSQWLSFSLLYLFIPTLVLALIWMSPRFLVAAQNWILTQRLPRSGLVWIELLSSLTRASRLILKSPSSAITLPLFMTGMIWSIDFWVVQSLNSGAPLGALCLEWMQWNALSAQSFYFERYQGFKHLSAVRMYQQIFNPQTWAGIPLIFIVWISRVKSKKMRVLWERLKWT